MGGTTGSGGAGGVGICNLGNPAPWRTGSPSTLPTTDYSSCTGAAGNLGTACTAPGQSSSQNCAYNQYCATDGTCKQCTPADGQSACTTQDCSDCCTEYSSMNGYSNKGYSHDGVCIQCTTRNGTNDCKNSDCSDCCETANHARPGGLNNKCVECLKTSDCFCSGQSNKVLCVNNQCTCTQDDHPCVFADCHDCCSGNALNGYCFKCTVDGHSCRYDQCEDCCRIAVPLTTCTCGP